MDRHTLPDGGDDPVCPDFAAFVGIGAFSPDADTGVYQEDIADLFHIHEKDGLAPVRVAADHIEAVIRKITGCGFCTLHGRGIRVIPARGFDKKDISIRKNFMSEPDVPEQVVLAFFRVGIPADHDKRELPGIGLRSGRTETDQQQEQDNPESGAFHERILLPDPAGSLLCAVDLLPV